MAIADKEFLTGIDSKASAAETVEVTMPDFGILINGDAVYNKYAKYP